MRKWLLIGGTLLVVTVAFAMVMMAQRGLRIAMQEKPPTPAPRPAAATTQFGSIGQTESAWVVIPDKMTGLPLVRFRGAEFTPQPGDQMLVDRPQVEFFLPKDRTRVVRIVGKTGLVSMPGGGPRIRSDLSSTPVQAPTRGVMDDVVVTYYPTQQAAADNKPQITLTLPKAYFDNELYELGSEQYVDANGNKIAAKDVPVVVRSEEFEFDGKGLLLRWDQVGNHLKSLTIDQGGQLVIKRAADRLAAPKTTASDQAPAAAKPVRTAAAEPKPATPAPANSDAAVVGAIYRATFHDGVKVTQDEQTLATAHEMHVDFAEHAAESGQTAAPLPTPAPLDRKQPSQAPPGAPAAAATVPAPTLAGKDAVGLASDKPIVIRWGGQMTVARAPEEPLKPESQDDAIVRFASGNGEPVMLYADGGTVEASWVAYQVAKQFAWVEGAADKPVKMTDVNKSVLVTPQLRYSRENGEVTLHGPSSADVKTDVDGEMQTLKATWRDLAVATINGPIDKRAVSRLVLKGQVNVENQRIKRFNAGSLAVDFADGENAGTKRQLKRITAADNVDCVIVDSDDKSKEQYIRAGNLKLTMAPDAAGKMYPAQLEASGNVTAGDGTQQIKAQSIQAELEPSSKQKAATRPAGPTLAGLRQLLATGAVQLTGAKGELVKCDRLQVKQAKERSSWVVLEGKPATIVQDQTTLSGAFIEVDTETQKAVVTGGGRMAVPAAKLASGGKSMPVEITWLGDGKLDGQANTASVAGGVLVKYTDADGTSNEAACDRAEILLAQKQSPTTKENKEKDHEFDFMAERYAKQLTLLPSEGKDVKLQQLLPGLNGTIASQLNLLAMRLDCYLDEQGVVQRIEVPATAQRPGRFLYVALPVATRKPVKTGDPLKSVDMAGATAFAWREKLVYDKSAGQMVMTGDVMVRHEPDSAGGGKGFQVDAQTIVAEVGGKASGQALSADTIGEVKRITLTGKPAHLTRDDADMTAPEVVIEPATNMVYARGTPREQVQVERGRMIGSFDTVDLNAKTGEMSFKRGAATGRQ